MALVYSFFFIINFTVQINIIQMPFGKFSRLRTKCIHKDLVICVSRHLFETSLGIILVII